MHLTLKTSKANSEVLTPHETLADKLGAGNKEEVGRTQTYSSS